MIAGTTTAARIGAEILGAWVGWVTVSWVVGSDMALV